MDKPADFEIADREHAAFRLTGPMTLPDAVQRITTAITFAREQNVPNLLVVASEATGVGLLPSVTTRYVFVNAWADTSRGKVRVALVVCPEMIDPRKFGVTVAVNRGLVGDVFTSEEDARSWLASLSHRSHRN